MASGLTSSNHAARRSEAEPHWYVRIRIRRLGSHRVSDADALARCCLASL